MTFPSHVSTAPLRINAPLFWWTLVIPLAIIAIGLNFVFNPVGASAGYGVAIQDPSAFPYMWIKGIRDIFFGPVVLAFLLRGDRRTTAIRLRAGDLHPFCDGWSS